MSSFFFDKFYHFFQGVLVFQTLSLTTLYFITKRRDILFYSCFLFIIAIYFFINAPNTFFNMNDDTVFRSKIYIYNNTPLIILANLFYVLFLKYFFKGVYFNDNLNTAFPLFILSVPVLIIASCILVYLGISNQLVFYLVNILTVGLSIYIIVGVLRSKTENSGWVVAGMAFNIIGTGLTVLMIVLERNSIRNTITVDYPLFFMRCGILADMFFYQIAILKKWHDQEKLLAIQKLQSQLGAERLRSQFSSELHDDLGASLSGISMYSHLVKSQIEESNTAAQQSLNIIKDTSAELVSKLNDIVWMTNPEQDSLNKLFDRLEEYAHQMAYAKNINVKVSFPDQGLVYDLPVVVRRNVYLICKEAINNAVKYSHCTVLELSIQEDNGKWNISVKDNGIGFSDKETKSGNGLINMKKRAEDIGAALKIKTTSQQGCEIILQLKFT